jgi:hypothetical protein
MLCPCHQPPSLRVPPEIWLKIGYHSTTKDIKHLSLTCSSFRNLLQPLAFTETRPVFTIAISHLQKHFPEEFLFFTSPRIAPMIRACVIDHWVNPSLPPLGSVEQHQGLVDATYRKLASFVNLRSLTFRDAHLTITHWQCLHLLANTLENFSIQHGKIDGLVEISLLCPPTSFARLQFLRLPSIYTSHPDFVRFLATCPVLMDLTITPSSGHDPLPIFGSLEDLPNLTRYAGPALYAPLFAQGGSLRHLILFESTGAPRFNMLSLLVREVARLAPLLSLIIMPHNLDVPTLFDIFEAIDCFQSLQRLEVHVDLPSPNVHFEVRLFHPFRYQS